jgi:2-oxoglutarate dehydrogenase E2 component (dihydrolipoamide succinyltransferase)
LEERIRLSRRRQPIASRLVEAQQTAAMLTTFNEVDMTEVMALRDQYKESFEKRHKVKLGFMGFFVKAAIQALMEAIDSELGAMARARRPRSRLPGGSSGCRGARWWWSHRP